MSIIKKLQKQIIKVEEINKDFCDMVAEGCNADEGDGQFYNGVRIDEDTILVLSTWYDRTSNSEDYFHYSISRDKLTPVDAEMDEKYRDLFEDCNMLDYTDCFFIMGVEPIAIGDSDLLYGDEYNDTIVNLFDEPKCTKCGSELEEEIWKTPTTDYEEYICSNEKCCAVHTINIDTELDDDGERTGDIERYWDTLDFSYIWEQGLKKDEPKDEILDKAKALIKAIDDNKWSLWENDIEIKHDCILWYEDNYQLNEDDVTGEWETEHKNGIQKAYKDLKNAMEERK